MPSFFSGRSLRLAGSATVLAVLVGGTTAYAVNNTTVELTVDGKTSQVRAWGTSVEDVLDAADVDVTDRDLVAPAPESKIGDGDEVVVQHARELTVTVDGETSTYWTTALTVDDALGELDLRADGAWLSASRSAPLGRSGLDLDIRTAKDVTLAVAGEADELSSTGATVGDLLAEQGVELANLDTVSIPVEAPLADGMTVAVTRIRTDRVTETAPIAAPVEERESADLLVGRTEVVQAGSPGTQQHVVRRTIVDGKVTGSKRISTEVVTAPVAKVVAVGTKKPPAPAPEPAPAPRAPSAPAAAARPAPSAPSTPSTSAPSGSVWDRLAECESGGNWSINTGNGYYGGVQFSLQTWRAMGGSGYPHENSREQQIAIATKLQQQSGWGQWPACSRKLGLR